MGNQSEDCTQLISAIVDVQLQGPIVAMNMEEMTLRYSQKENEKQIMKVVVNEDRNTGMTSKSSHIEDDEQDSYQLLIKCEDDISLLHVSQGMQWIDESV